MNLELQKQIFVDFVAPQTEADANNSREKPVINGGNMNQEVSHEKVQLLFPNATMYINEKNESILIEKSQKTFWVKPKIL